MAASASGWDMSATVTLPSEVNGTQPAGGTVFPGGTYGLKKDSSGRICGDDFPGTGDGTTALNAKIWDVLDNQTTDGGRGVHSASNIIIANSIAELRVTQAAGSTEVMCAGAEGSGSYRNYKWVQSPGDLVVWASRRLDGTDTGLKQIVLNWTTDGSWPPENDGQEHFSGTPSQVGKTTHDLSAGKGNNHQYPTNITDTCTVTPKWSTWHRWAMLNQGRDSWYWTDHGAGFVLDAHHVVPVGYEIGDMRFPGIGHHNKTGAHTLTQSLYRFQIDFVALLVATSTPSPGPGGGDVDTKGH